MWVIFKADGAAPGWENRVLMPEGAYTGIIAEETWHDGKIPQVGDRVYESRRDGEDVMARDGDWMVTAVEPFTSPEGNQIVVCHCTYSPITPRWEKLERLTPVPASVAA